MLIFILSGCNLAPVLEGDYNRNLTEIKSAITDVKRKIAENAGIVNTAVSMKPEEAQIITKYHAQQVSEWSRKPVELTPAQSGSMWLEMGLGVLGLAGLGGAAGKIRSLSNLVKKVAVMPPEEGKAEVNKRGYAV